MSSRYLYTLLDDLLDHLRLAVAELIDLSVESVDLSLVLCVDGVHIRGAAPSSLAEVVGQADLSIETVVVAVPSALAIALVDTVGIALKTIPTQLEVDSQLRRNTEGVEDTNAQLHSIGVVAHVAGDTTASEGNEVPDTLLVVAADQVAEVEEHLLVRRPVLVALAGLVVQNRLAPDTIDLGTETDARREPLTHGNRSTYMRTEILDRAIAVASTMLLT